jgi:hypothetical protein
VEGTEKGESTSLRTNPEESAAAVDVETKLCSRQKVNNIYKG